MYSLDRTNKIKIVCQILSVVFLVLSVISYFRGGDELLTHNFINDPFHSIVMIVSFGTAIVCFLISVVIHAIQKDIAEYLKYLDNQEKE